MGYVLNWGRQKQETVVEKLEISENLNNVTSTRKWRISYSFSVSTLLKENFPKHSTRRSQSTWRGSIWWVSVITLFGTEQARTNGLKWNITTAFTFDGSPLCFSAQQPPPVDLILLVTAHHSKRDHLLFNGRGGRTTVTPRTRCWQLRPPQISFSRRTGRRSSPWSYRWSFCPRCPRRTPSEGTRRCRWLAALPWSGRQHSNVKANSIHRGWKRIRSQISTFRCNYAAGYCCPRRRRAARWTDYSGINANLSSNLRQKL